MIELVIEGRARDLGGFGVRRVLPHVMRHLVGPFIFFDQMGPANLAPGAGFDVRPHPHIGLATVTYLFEGQIDHRDSLGTARTIRPGDVNWMVAGKGITHSERATKEDRAAGFKLHGIQSWVALPPEHAEVAPSFQHHPKEKLPKLRFDNVVLDVIAGTAYGETSPVKVLSPTLYVHAQLEAGARMLVDDEHHERAVYVVEGMIAIDGKSFGSGALVILTPGARVGLAAEEKSRLMLLGGAKLDAHYEIYWNFVSTSKERIERAKDDWTNQRFAKVPGDDEEWIPLPDART